MGKKFHTYHIVTPSPWPLLFSICVAIPLPIGAVLYMHYEEGGSILMFLSLTCGIILFGLWCYDIIIEGTYQGMHTINVQKNLKLGVILFIISEIMFFSSFFWAFFHSSLAPAIQIGSVWPPVGILPFSPFGIPLLNTFILLSSGISITAAHIFMVNGNLKKTINNMFITLIFAVSFTILQLYEYLEAQFTIADSVYGSIFFMATGFHGAHVIIGTIFIGVMLLRVIGGHFSKTHHIGFEASIWYWHFVDVVWLFLYIIVYYWGNLNYK